MAAPRVPGTWCFLAWALQASVGQDSIADVPIQERPKVPAPPPEGLEQPCSRSLSREAVQIVEDEFLPVIRHAGLPLQDKCKLNPGLNMFRAHEANKTKEGLTRWRCKTCGKTFRSQHYIDLHFDRRHMDTLPENATVCFGDFCSILGCKSLLDGDLASACSPRDMSRRRARCEALVHDCVLPSRHRQARVVMARLEASFCARLDCSRWGKAMRAKPNDGSTLWLVLVSVVISLVAVAYAMAWCWHMDRQHKPDFAPRGGRIQRMLWRIQPRAHAD